MDRQAVVISAEQATVSFVRDALEPLGFSVMAKQKHTTALRSLTGNEIVILDVSDMARSLKEIKSYHPEALIIVLNDRGCQGKAIGEEAYFCLEKPSDMSLLQTAVRNASRHQALRLELDRIKDNGHQRSTAPENLKTHIPSQRLRRLVERASVKEVPVLISGEKGTGREFLAKTIHQMSTRRHGPFASLEASDRQWMEGRFKETLASLDGGTLYIKNLEGVSPKLSEALATDLGSTEQAGHTDIRLICGANGRFNDTPLMERFGIVVKLPPLRSRPGDIIPLAETFASQAADMFSLGTVKLSKSFRDALKRHTWPANVRELKNTVTLACLLAQGGTVKPEHMFSGGGEACASVKEFLEVKLGRYLKDINNIGKASLHDAVISEVEKSLIELVLSETGGNQLRTASALGITRTTLRSKIKTFKITPRKTKNKSK